MSVTDPDRFRSFETGLRLIDTAPPRRETSLAASSLRVRPPADVGLLTGSSAFEAGRAEPTSAWNRHGEGAAFSLPARAILLYPDRSLPPPSLAPTAGQDDALCSISCRLKAMGLTVGVIKHHIKDVEDDVPGKDSHRHSLSGAATSALVTPARTTARRRGPEEEVDKLLAREFSSCDLVLIEGYKTLPIPKIEVLRSGVSPVAVEGAVARVSDLPASDRLPTVPLGDHDAILSLVLRLSGLDRARRGTP